MLASGPLGRGLLPVCNNALHVCSLKLAQVPFGGFAVGRMAEPFGFWEDARPQVFWYLESVIHCRRELFVRALALGVTGHPEVAQAPLGWRPLLLCRCGRESLTWFLSLDADAFVLAALGAVGMLCLAPPALAVCTRADSALPASGSSRIASLAPRHGAQELIESSVGSWVATL